MPAATANATSKRISKQTFFFQWTTSLDNSCDTKYQHMLGSLVYAAGLLLAVTVLAVKSRHIRDNYREAMYIGLAVGCTAPLCVGWAVAGLWATQPGDQDGCLALGLGATAALVLLVMFMPKGRQLAAMGRDGLYDEDKLSTLSRPASPSFFHFKPFMTPMKHTSTINTFGGKLETKRFMIFFFSLSKLSSALQF